MPRAAIHPQYPDLPSLEVLRGSAQVYRPTGWRQGHFSPEGRWYWDDNVDNPRPIPRDVEDKRRIFLPIFFKYSKLMAFKGDISDSMFSYIPEDTWTKAFSPEDTKGIINKEERLIADSNWYYMGIVWLNWKN